MPTLTRTATNQTAGPLAQIHLRINELATHRNLLNFSQYYNINNSIWTLPSLNLILDNNEKALLDTCATYFNSRDNIFCNCRD